ncbi:MAG: hypothetical protein IT280_05560 [Ignavibacteria bacterium]|nr:hypothetical protein [Ignavibacteria bacterium]
MNFSEYNKEESNKIPIAFLMLYLFLSIAICILYHIKIVSPADWNAPNSLNAVGSFSTSKPYQFRLLMPVIFDAFPGMQISYSKYLYTLWNMAVLFLLQVVFYKLICRYFMNHKYLFWIAPVILYPILFNYIILNQSFQYYDFTAILFFTAGLYYIQNKKFFIFLMIFIAAVINKETAGYLIFSYILFNYKELFTKKILKNVFILSVFFIGYKLLLSYIFSGNPGDDFEIGYYKNLITINELFTNRVYMKSIFLNFGGLYIFSILLFITGFWNKYPDKRKLFMNLTIVPYYLLGIYVTYLSEVRVYTELIPMITILFLIFLSNFKSFGLVGIPQKEGK